MGVIRIDRHRNKRVHASNESIGIIDHDKFIIRCDFTIIITIRSVQNTREPVAKMCYKSMLTYGHPGQPKDLVSSSLPCAALASPS